MHPLENNIVFGALITGGVPIFVIEQLNSYAFSRAKQQSKLCSRSKRIAKRISVLRSVTVTHIDSSDEYNQQSTSTVYFDSNLCKLAIKNLIDDLFMDFKIDLTEAQYNTIELKYLAYAKSQDYDFMRNYEVMNMSNQRICQIRVPHKIIVLTLCICQIF